ncbi:MAG: hypothetical protein HS104_33085 [Polyangiaceae bacterium]|nr:hypothetical protein [Polyangiaceae bacterium]MCE7893262.1 hypothetical protein [Sorangiineae bacterium PRO1]MCL4755013.1 hypothetical protein [Myxococcales bacterium]
MRSQRVLGYLGVVAAALASIATSQPTWDVDDEVSGLHDELGASAPESVRHFSVESSDEHTVRVSGTLKWDLNPAAMVRVSIAKDDGSPVQEGVYRADEAKLVGPGRRRDTVISLGQHQECETKPCEQGYTVTVRLEEGAPQERVFFDWRFTASMSGSGDGPPKDSYVKVVED